jgi:hypothetical protein
MCSYLPIAERIKHRRTGLIKDARTATIEESSGKNSPCSVVINQKGYPWPTLSNAGLNHNISILVP